MKIRSGAVVLAFAAGAIIFHQATAAAQGQQQGTPGSQNQQQGMTDTQDQQQGSTATQDQQQGVGAAQRQPTSTAASFRSLTAVIVTATKVAKPIVDVPLAITAITASDIQDAGMLDLQDVAPYIPGLEDQSQTVGRNDRGFRDYSMRGIIAENGLDTRQTANIFVDGVLDFSGDTTALSDVDHIEVVKGPQAAYFGIGTFGGAINYVTRAPSLTHWTGQANFDAGSYDERTFSASVNGPIIDDRLSIRLSARSYYTGGDYPDPGYPGTELGQQSTESQSISLLFKPIDNLSIRSYNTYFTDDDGASANGELFASSYNCNAGAAPPGTLNYHCGEVTGAMIPTSSMTNSTYIDPLAYQELQTGGGIAGDAPFLGPNFVNHIGVERHAWTSRNQFEYDFTNGYEVAGAVALDSNRWGFLLSNSGIDARNIPNPDYGIIAGVLPYQYDLIISNQSDFDYNLDLRISSPSKDRLNWTVGLDYLNDLTQGQTCGYLFFGYAGCFTPLEKLKNSTPSIYEAINYSILPTLTLSVEGRYQISTVGETDFPAGAPPLGVSNRSDVYTPRLSLQYKPADRITYYISYAQGTLPVEFNTNLAVLSAAEQAQIAKQANTTFVVPHENMQMEEIGAKGDFLHNTLEILADAYAGIWSNRHIPQNVSFTTPEGALSGIQVVSAGGIVDLHGIELEASYLLGEHLTLHATADWAETDIRKTDSADALLLTGNSDPVGKQLPLYPAETATFTATYQRHAFGDFDGFARVDYVYRSKIYDDEADVAWTAPISTVDIGFGISNERYRVEIYGRNIGDNTAPVGLTRTAYSVYNAAGATTGSLLGLDVSPAYKPVYGIRGSIKFGVD
ncbi:MAG TPA: TonB-dependent receptor plug domain-containing protein [Steroidobacteraceae bacterium]